MDFNVLSLERLGGADCSCLCGVRHGIFTEDIIFREGALDCLAEIVERLAGRGGKALVFCGSGCGLRSAVLARLGGFLIEVKELSSSPDVGDLAEHCQVADDVRILIAVGGGEVCDAVKYIATACGKPSIVVPDKIVTDTFLAPVATLMCGGFREVFKVVSPAALIADFDVLLDISDSEAAGAFGTIVSKYITLFDWRFSNIITNEKICSDIVELMSAAIDDALEGAERIRRHERPALVKIVELNIRAGLYAQLADSGRLLCGGEAQLEHTLAMLFAVEERDLKSRGENLMLCAVLLAKVYKHALERDFSGLILPPDNVFRADCISEFLGGSAHRVLRKLRPLLSEDVLESRRHKLKEYRAELYQEIAVIEKRLQSAYTLFKRMYDDAGYSLSQYLDPADFKIALPLAPDITDKFTLLSMLKDLGLLENYLPKAG